jgi:DNA-binding transcriptional LysR family regulator
VSIYDHLEFRHLKYIIAIADERTFTAAASRVHVAQSALSTQIKQLEEIFEVPIFDRDREGVSLTAQGQILLTFARRIVRGREELIDALRAFRPETFRPLKIGFSSFVEKHILGALLDSMRAIAPDVDFIPEADETERLETRVIEGELDCAAVTLPIMNTTLRVSVLDSEPLVVCMRDDDLLASGDAVPTHALNGKLSIFSNQQDHPAAYKHILEMLEAVNISPKPSHPTSNREHVQWLVKQRACYALVRSGETLLSGLTTRPIYGAKWTIDTALIVKNQGQHPLISLLLSEFPLVTGLPVSSLPRRKPASSLRSLLREPAAKKRVVVTSALPLFDEVERR